MASLTQIAAKAGVSITAASLVLNKQNHGTRVSPECAERIRAIAKEMGYVANYHASSIKSGRSGSIAVALDTGDLSPDGKRIVARPELAVPYFGLILAGVEAAVRTRGLMLTLVVPDANNRAPERGLIGIRQRRFDGMIVYGTVLKSQRTTILQNAPEYPIVVIEPPTKTKLPSIVYDEDLGVKLAVDHLVQLGHKRLLWVGIESSKRRQTFMQYCTSLGVEAHEQVHLSPRDEHGFHDDMNLPDAAHTAVSKYLKENGQNFTAVVAYNDVVAMGVMDALFDAGLHVPADVSVVGHDDFEGRRFRPKLTSIDHRLEDMGRQAAELLMEMVADASLIRQYRGRSDTVEPRLSVRGSTAAPKFPK